VIAVTIIHYAWLVKVLKKTALAPKLNMLGTYKKLHKKRSLQVYFWFKSHCLVVFPFGVTKFGNLCADNWLLMLDISAMERCMFSGGR